MLVVFDVDGTLLKGDSLFLAARQSRSKIGFLISIIKFIPFIIPWKLKIISDERIKEIFIRYFKVCEKFNREEEKGNSNWFLDTLIKDIRPEAFERINYHKEKGDEIILCSASFDMLLFPLAKYLEIGLISSKLIREKGKWLPLYSGKNCKGINKIYELVKQRGSLKNFVYEAYGNSEGDKDLMQNSKIPHYRSFSRKINPYPKYPIKSLIIIIGATFFSYGIFSTINQNNIFGIVINYYPIILKGLFLIIFGYFLRFIRWRIILFNLKIDLPFWNDLLIWMGSYTFTATPGKAGETVRALLLKDKFGTSISKTVAAIFFERFIDGLSVLSIVFLNYRLFIKWNFFEKLYLVNLKYLFFYLIITFLGIFFLKNHIKNFFRRILPDRFITNLKNFISQIRKLASWKIISLTLPLGILSWIFEGMSLWILIRGISNFKISLVGSTIAHTLAGIIGVFSMIPGGLGTTEFSLVNFLYFQGLSIDVAASSTIIIRLMTIWFATFLGFIALAINRLKN